jgi:hypothetical protein
LAPRAICVAENNQKVAKQLLNYNGFKTLFNATELLHLAQYKVKNLTTASLLSQRQQQIQLPVLTLFLKKQLLRSETEFLYY